jgi:ketosteroid isomerase-like protein
LHLPILRRALAGWDLRPYLGDYPHEKLTARRPGEISRARGRTMIGAWYFRAAIKKGMESQIDRDLAGMTKYWTDDIVLELSGPSHLAGRYEGKEAVAAFFRWDWDQLESDHMKVRRIALTRPLAFGLTNVAMVEFSADVVSKHGTSGRIEGVSVIEIKRGKTKSIRNHYFDAAVIDRVFRTPIGHSE